MSCISIDKCECIKRISILLNKYQLYQEILHPHECDDDNPASTPIEENNDNDLTDDNENENTDTYVVEYVEEIDDYCNYDENIDPNQQILSNELLEEEEQEEEENNEDIESYLDKLNITEILNDYNHIIIDHYNINFELIYNLITNKYSYFLCDINKCGSLIRNNRFRETENILLNNSHDLKDLSINNLIIIDLIDSIHCHLLHLFDIGLNINNISSYDLLQENDDEKIQEINLNKLRKIALEKQKYIIKLRGINRIKNNKFKTDTNENDKIINHRRLSIQAVSIDFDEEEIKEINNEIEEKEYKQKHKVEQENKKHEQNVYKFGHKICDSNKITPKYADLKEEILNNNIYKFSIEIYNEIILKSEIKLRCLISRSLTSDEYGPLLIENLIVLLLYIDYDIFRNKYRHELNTSKLIVEFYNFHFGLENTVILWGINMYDNNKYNSFYHNNKQLYYHSISSKVIFEGTKCQFLNITSLSADISPVLLYNSDNNINNNGIILEFGPFDLRCKYFICSWLSSYGGEDERLFMNKSGYLELQNIILNKPAQIDNNFTQCNFKLFLQALACFDGSLCEGWKSTNTTTQHYNIINKLILIRDSIGHINNRTYMQEIFNKFCDNKLQIEILVQNLRGPFCELLFQNDSNASYQSVSTQLIRFDILCKLFTNCRHIITWYVGNNDYNQHSGINEQWLKKLYVMLDNINMNINNYKSKLNKIIINNNHQKVEPIIENKLIQMIERKFFEKGWKIEQINCSDKMNKIIVTKIMIWTNIKINSFDVLNGNYYIKTDNLETYVSMKYHKIRDLFEEINKIKQLLSSDIKELKKLFPSQSIFKKNNNKKLMLHRQNKLNQYFEKLIKIANKQNDNIKMKVMTMLTCYLI